MAKKIVDEEMRFSIIVNGNQAQEELFEIEKATRKLERTNKDLRSEKARLIGQGKKDSEAYKRVTAEIRQNNKVLKVNKDRMKLLQNQIGITGLTMGQLTRKATMLKLELRNMVPGSGKYKRLTADLKEVSAQILKLRGNAASAKTSLGSIANGFSKYAALGASVIAATTGMVLSAQRLIDYNGKLADAQSNVQKTTKLTKDEANDLMKSFGLFKTRTARIELLKLAEEGGRLGIEGVKNIKDFVEVANQLKVALGDDISDVQIREVGKMVKIYKVGERTGRDFKNSLLSLGSAINEVSASGSNTAGFLVDYLKRQAGVSSQTKISAEDNVAYAATFDELGQSVEVSATAMNKIWVDMFDDAATYANIAGVSLEEYTNLLNTDANQAMILFLKGLNGNNQGFSVMVDKLKDLEVGGARGIQALSALASNTELLEERQTLSNQALGEAISLTNEYELKNNNLAGTIDKVKKKLIATFSSEFWINSLSTIIVKFGQLIGAIENVDDAFKNETKRTYESAKSNRKLADSASNLYSEYKSLVKDGVEPTSESKERLEEITLSLKNMFGDSVVSINKETGALTLNTKAVLEQIKIKRLAADGEAATLVSRLRGAKDNKSALEEDLPTLKEGYKVQVRIAAKAKEAYKATAAYQEKNKRARQLALLSLPEVKQELEAFKALNKLKGDIAQQDIRRIDIVKKLEALSYTEQDADNYFKKNPSEVTPAGTTPTFNSSSTSSSKTKKAKNLAEDLLQVQRDAEDRKLELTKDSFDKEMLLEDFNHFRKIEDLQKKLISQDIINTAADKNLKNSYLAKNAALNSQIESENELHEIRKSTIIENGFQSQIEQKQIQFEREQQARIIAFNNELAALGDNDLKRQRLEEQFEKEELERTKTHLQDLKVEFQKLVDSGEFKGFDLKLLSPEQLQAIKDRLSELGLSISEINSLLAIMRGEGSGSEFASEIDVLGFSIEDWEQTFGNLETLEGKIRAAEMGVGAFMNAWGMYNKFVSINQKKELQAFEKSNTRKKEKQKQLLDNGFINERQYTDSIKALEAEADKKKAELEYKAAKREKAMNIASAIANTAVGVSKALAQGGLVLGIPWAAIVGALGAVQIGLAAAQPLPAKGYEKGHINVQREQDGKMFNASFGGESRTGLVDKPTVFLAGEGGKNFPEMIIDGASFKQMNPDVKQALYGELARVKGYEKGFVQNDTNPISFNNTNSTAAPSDSLLIATLTRTNSLLDNLDKNGVTAFMDKNFRNIKKLHEELDRYTKIKQKNKR